MTATRALALFGQSNLWLREILRNQDAKCSCGHCFLCAYRFFESEYATAKEIEMCTHKDEAKAKMDRLIETMERLIEALDSTRSVRSHTTFDHPGKPESGGGRRTG